MLYRETSWIEMRANEQWTQDKLCEHVYLFGTLLFPLRSGYLSPFSLDYAFTIYLGFLLGFKQQVAALRRPSRTYE